MGTSVYLVFGDLHGRILPAFRLASVWSREFDQQLAGVLQVGDLGYFPDMSRLDKATLRHAKDDPTELGAQDIIETNGLADAVFGDPHCPPAMWFTAGNHEDFDALNAMAGNPDADFAIDAYGKVRCIKNGRIADVGIRVGALWGVDGDGATTGNSSTSTRTGWPRSRDGTGGRADGPLGRRSDLSPLRLTLSADAPS